jgi:ABC-type antimicrobial peptide transport system permease subunit
MKTKKVMLSILAMVLSVIGFANEPGDPRLVVVSHKPGLYKVIYESKAQKVFISIYNYDGAEVFSKAIKCVHGFILPVNFDGMLPGEYTIQVVEPNGKQTQKITYTPVTVTANIHVSKMTDKDKYLLSVMNADEELIRIRIFDGADNLVHDERIAISGNFGLIYNLKQVTGTPTFEITDKTGVTKVIKQ